MLFHTRQHPHMPARSWVWGGVQGGGCPSAPPPSWAVVAPGGRAGGFTSEEPGRGASSAGSTSAFGGAQWGPGHPSRVTAIPWPRFGWESSTRHLPQLTPRTQEAALAPHPSSGDSDKVGPRPWAGNG